ncbi:hypothetical protein PBI_KESHU_65 [Mycobacterium phage Keshu]|uniref:Uncharacterized protein n=2 Tax=Keshuvirus TaxID=2948781 RepID=A0A0F6WF14_9CAUD|nr:hypothetical protein PBI_KESHU_65 [Mycobacterium phage Keshu]YP_009202695.1 hypothetical protein SEA_SHEDLOCKHOLMES_64 [Mycobacterium phage ShedlockHolmes]AJD82285.1 hypothetical protein PBI_KESHU_65 [Mycobacterium phage Keshu]AKF15241.1 hypothetical protein SEA_SHEDLOCKHOLMES_64 [Mycobacterium phage ShedlockHolmes]
MTQRSEVADKAARLHLVVAPTAAADVDRWLWQQQIDTNTATERVADRQVRLLTVQREILDSQLAEATAKRDGARQAVELAREMLAACEVEK